MAQAVVARGRFLERRVECEVWRRVRRVVRSWGRDTVFVRRLDSVMGRAVVS